MFDGLMPVPLDRPSIAGLAYVLRHREMWPKGFAWQYIHCDTCAIGLAGQLWDMKMNHRTVGNAIGLSELDAVYIFTKLGRNSMRTVTPEHVADALDAYLGELPTG